MGQNSSKIVGHHLWMIPKYFCCTRLSKFDCDFTTYGKLQIFFEHPSKKMHLSLFLSKHLKKLSLFLVRLFRLIYRVSHRKVWKVILLWYLRIHIWIFSDIRGPVCSWETPFFAYLLKQFLLNQCCTSSMVQFAKHLRIFFSQYFDF